MTITIDLPPKAQEQLDQRAVHEGTPKEVVASRILSEALDWDARDFEEAVEGIRNGLDDCKAGRVKPASEVIDRLEAVLKNANK